MLTIPLTYDDGAAAANPKSGIRRNVAAASRRKRASTGSSSRSIRAGPRGTTAAVNVSVSHHPSVAPTYVTDQPASFETVCGHALVFTPQLLSRTTANRVYRHRTQPRRRRCAWSDRGKKKKKRKPPDSPSVVASSRPRVVVTENRPLYRIPGLLADEGRQGDALQHPPPTPTRLGSFRTPLPPPLPTAAGALSSSLVD